jgi:hypothetical protein
LKIRQGYGGWLKASLSWLLAHSSGLCAATKNYRFLLHIQTSISAPFDLQFGLWLQHGAKNQFCCSLFTMAAAISLILSFFKDL